MGTTKDEANVLNVVGTEPIASSSIDQQQAARTTLIGQPLTTQRALIAALQDNLLRAGDQVKVTYKHFASNGSVSTREQVGSIRKIVSSISPRKTGQFEYQKNIDKTTLLYVDDRGIALENMASLTLEKLAASSSVKEYLLPMDDPITRGAVMSIAEIVFKQAQFITDEDILNFKVNLTWTTFLNLNISQREVVVDSLASDNSASRTIAEAVLLAANSYPAIFSGDRLMAVLDNLLLYAEHFREIEQYQIFDERFRDSHALAVRFLASHLIVLDVDPGEFIALVHDIQQNIQSIQSTHTSIEQYLKKTEIENDFIVEIIREALPASFRNTENWGEFYFILSDAQRFLNNKQIESAIMSLGYSVASSTVSVPYSQRSIVFATELTEAILRNRAEAEFEQYKTFFDGDGNRDVNYRRYFSEENLLARPSLARAFYEVDNHHANLDDLFENEDGQLDQILSIVKKNLRDIQIDQDLQAGNNVSNSSSGIIENGEENVFNKGGIDFDPTNMDLQIKRDGKGVPLPLPQQNLEQINIQGLFPVIINIIPMNAQTLPIFLGFTRPNSGDGQSFEALGGQLPKEPAREPELAATTSG